MNILIVTDDGPEAFGWKLLQDIARARYKDAHIIAMCTDRPMVGQGMAITSVSDMRELKLTPLAKDKYSLMGKPVDLIYYAFYHPEHFIERGKTWDLVLSGINHGQNTGAEILHSGTVGMALFASSYFGCGAVAISQRFVDQNMVKPEDVEVDRKKFQYAQDWIYNLLGTYDRIRPGECYNVNLPIGKPVMWRNTRVAVYASFRRHTAMEGRKLPRTDTFELEHGYGTITEMQLNVDVPLNY